MLDNLKNYGIKISILIPVYNSKQYLKKCIDSVLNQTYRNIELILVNDGSIDGSDQLCEKYAMIDPRVRVIHKSNSGVVDTRKLCVEYASGSYCICVDSDDYLCEDYVEKMIKIIAEYDPDIICCGFIKTDNYMNVLPKFRSGYYSRNQINSEIMPCCLASESGNSFPVNLWAKAYKTELCRSMLSIPESEMSFSEDLCCVAYGLCKCTSLYILSESLYYYRNNPSSVCNIKSKPWDIPEKIERTMLKFISMDNCNYREQLNRRLFMEIYGVICSQIKSTEPLSVLIKQIFTYLNEPNIRNVITNCSFKKSIAWKARIWFLKSKVLLFIFVCYRKIIHISRSL